MGRCDQLGLCWERSRLLPDDGRPALADEPEFPRVERDLSIPCDDDPHLSSVAVLVADAAVGLAVDPGDHLDEVAFGEDVGRGARVGRGEREGRGALMGCFRGGGLIGHADDLLRLACDWTRTLADSRPGVEAWTCCKIYARTSRTCQVSVRRVNGERLEVRVRGLMGHRCSLSVA